MSDQWLLHVMLCGKPLTLECAFAFHKAGMDMMMRTLLGEHRLVTFGRLPLPELSERPRRRERVA